MDALIGYTGFVGSILASQHRFTDLYNSKNSAESAGKSYDLFFCAAAPGKKWLANQHPAEDRAAIDSICRTLEKITIHRFVLISTVDVYDTLSGVDEDHGIESSTLQPYGKHRLLLEEYVRERYERHHIIRLPALFGPGLRKNFIFDLLNNRMLDYTHPDSMFQFYNMNRIWQDIQTVLSQNIPLITMATEPLRAGDIAKTVAHLELKPGNGVKPVQYNLKSKYAQLFGGKNGYLYGKDQILKEIQTFIKTEPKTKLE
ncbi:MAG: pyridine nucleotide transhydrogenase [Patescibacteria group bacterium]|nr:pyridine nucleotide transhydrogenase [Patescibacteria group bacterium]